MLVNLFKRSFIDLQKYKIIQTDQHIGIILKPSSIIN